MHCPSTAIRVVFISILNVSKLLEAVMTKSSSPEESPTIPEQSIEILIAGIVRDCRRTIVPSINQLQNLLGSTVNLSYFLVESDSKDETKLILEELSNKDLRFNYKSLGNLAPEIPDRIRRIAYCRNQYISYLQDQLAMGKKIDYLLVADFDGVNAQVSLRAAGQKLLSSDTIVSANQKGFYYDILALRASSWVEEDYRISITKHRSSRDSLTNFLKFVSLKQRRISKNEPPIKVLSAFGGLAIYPVSLLDGCRYEPKELAPDICECEHVGFNAKALSNGGQMVILPTLRNKGSLPHTLFAHRLPRYALQILILLRVPSLLRKFEGMINASRAKKIQ
jgi:hypothetical protein